MGDIIPFKKKGPLIGNLITSHPFEFRTAGWQSIYFIQMLRSEAERLENTCAAGGFNCPHLPMHFVLKDGNACTIQNLYYYRYNEEQMREVYYLSGLIDCVINRICPLLRTEMIHEVYRKIMTLKKILNVKWHGRMNQILLPIDLNLYRMTVYKNQISRVKTSKELYDAIRSGTDEMFQILKCNYVYYLPGKAV